MPERVHSYPPVGDPDRYDSIVRRGKSMQRRRTIGTGLIGGGAAAIVLIAVLVATGSGGSTENSRKGVTADDPDATTTTAPPSGPTVEITGGAGEPIQIEVEDLAQIVHDEARKCVHVRLYDDPAGAAGDSLPIAEATNCDDLLDPLGGVYPLDLFGGFEPTEIGCAAAVENVDAPTGQGQPTASTFELVLHDIPAGEYVVDVQAASGKGDGCWPEDVGEAEKFVADEKTVIIP